MVWKYMLYPPNFLNTAINYTKDYHEMKLMFNNICPNNFKQIYNYQEFNKFNYKEHLALINKINNYFSKDTCLFGINSIYILIVTAIFQVCNTNKKQYFVFPMNSNAEQFYFKLSEILDTMNIKKKIKLSHSGIKDMEMIQKLNNFDIIVYTGGRFLNNIEFKNN